MVCDHGIVEPMDENVKSQASLMWNKREVENLARAFSSIKMNRCLVKLPSIIQPKRYLRTSVRVGEIESARTDFVNGGKRKRKYESYLH